MLLPTVEELELKNLQKTYFNECINRVIKGKISLKEDAFLSSMLSEEAKEEKANVIKSKIEEKLDEIKSKDDGNKKGTIKAIFSLIFMYVACFAWALLPYGWIVSILAAIASFIKARSAKEYTDEYKGEIRKSVDLLEKLKTKAKTKEDREKIDNVLYKYKAFLGI